ncbi:sigma-70 family RNA polymerase sigma factor [Aeoliella sp. SH292]|jgi:RNA polymerase sigma-70 factor (ECF subfamily)|uniref:sigma-70 family RNA polymerase sigma factor n=1 Tax=Aeoliella sp. SH292 TaxID=3454464 RepID=UPI003F9B5C12
MSSKEDLFASFFSANQQRIFGYILGLVRNTSDAQDVLQQTAVTAWQKFSVFDVSTDFLPWAVTIARYEALNFMKYRRRSRLCFDQELMEQLGEDVCEVPSDAAEDRLAALGECLKKLPAMDSKLIECRYTHGLSSLQIADILDRSQPSVCNSLRRIRENLMRCISKNLTPTCAL